MLRVGTAKQARGGEVSERSEGVQLTDEQRIDWLRLIRSPKP
jgi:gluconate kinase